MTIVGSSSDVIYINQYRFIKKGFIKIQTLMRNSLEKLDKGQCLVCSDLGTKMTFVKVRGAW